ncbi:putative PTS IIA-like nitrogen-regulatory protein PtsN [Coriobacterium glomerans PW2]|uniref:Ascorbate-specific PTS system EIIA component n=1 Tax=Coriobacterium glomerans (strain ATCC 49209 / DSM 20642 / JCM 10262 / PW2) TaxID=700015 RepID=F2NBE4_CORGP|nr:PTS sugar transporter subunit IIA [Coriobacterium glomerans]AEB06680.1 putative PTS IIA-like nitrogen-regulatory protein PtsN [Coriobacterium glomerans PW2]
MISDLLKGRMRLIPHADSWVAAISIAATPLLEDGIITARYIQAILQNVVENGSYFVLLPGIAMPHARPEYGSLGQGMSFLKLEEPVSFPDNRAVHVFFVIASDSDDGHLDMICSLAEILSDPVAAEELRHVSDPSTLIALLDSHR